MKNNPKVQSEREKKALIAKFEQRQHKKTSFSVKKEMYLKQTDRNYKDGDRN